jgi:hypothetical protein
MYILVLIVYREFIQTSFNLQINVTQIKATRNTFLQTPFPVKVFLLLQSITSTPLRSRYVPPITLLESPFPVLHFCQSPDAFRPTDATKSLLKMRV